MQVLPNYKHEIFLVSSNPVLPGHGSHQSLGCSQSTSSSYKPRPTPSTAT
ncbi:hypothetical protein AAZX31_02G218200 [Glycine max]